jgi:hypothetical protein
MIYDFTTRFFGGYKNWYLLKPFENIIPYKWGGRGKKSHLDTYYLEMSKLPNYNWYSGEWYVLEINHELKFWGRVREAIRLILGKKLFFQKVILTDWQWTKFKKYILSQNENLCEQAEQKKS